MANRNDSIAGILPQQAFDQGLSTWVGLISAPDARTLQAIFTSDSQLITGVGFSIERIAQLVSTIGAVRVKARFISQPLVPGGEPQFLVALFAVDALDARVSSYHVPEHLYLDKPDLGHAVETPARTIHKNEVSSALARRWLTNWADAPAVLPAYFASPYGPLRGYTFELSEFAAVFHHLRKLDNKRLRVAFVLHDFYQPDPAGGDRLAQTFALALQLDRQGKTGEGVTGGDDPILDMAQPCPPNC